MSKYLEKFSKGTDSLNQKYVDNRLINTRKAVNLYELHKNRPAARPLKGSPTSE